MFHPARTVVAIIVLVAGSAVGQSENGQQSQPLSGPKVTENKIPGVHATFGEASKSPGSRKDGRSIPPELIKRALGVLDRDDTPADARLTDDQRSRIDALVSDFKASVESYKQAHKAEMAQAQRVLGRDGAEPGKPKNKRESGPRPNPPSPPAPPSGEDPAMRDDPKEPHTGDSDEVAAARAKLADLRKNAPDTMDLQTQVWNVLNESQQTLVRAEVEKFIKSREEAQAREYVRKRMNKKGGPGDKGAPGLNADGTIDLSTLPPKLKERLEQMSPEEREQALTKLRERIKNGEAPARPGKKQGRGDGTPKPPPTMEDVPVPAPEDPPAR